MLVDDRKIWTDITEPSPKVEYCIETEGRNTKQFVSMKEITHGSNIHSGL